MIYLLLALAVTAIISSALAYKAGRSEGYRRGRWDGMEEGYADAMRDGWTAPKPGGDR